MIAANGILTSRGGKTSHAAVVARGMGKTCVCGAGQLDVDTLILAETDDDRQHALAALEVLQTGDFAEILQAMDGLPVTIRTIDPPLHEFLPDLTDLSVKVALEGDKATVKERRILAEVRRMHEQNPILGLRGVRLDLVIPGLFGMQVRAIAHAAAQLKKAGKASTCSWASSASPRSRRSTAQASGGWLRSRSAKVARHARAS